MSYRFTDLPSQMWKKQHSNGYLVLAISIESGPDISPYGKPPERKYEEVILAERLRSALRRINPQIPHQAINDATKRLIVAQSPSYLVNNHEFQKRLTDGIPVEVSREIELRH